MKSYQAAILGSWLETEGITRLDSKQLGLFLSSLREVSTASAVDPEHWRRPRSLIVGSFSGSFDAARARCPQYGEQLVVVNGEQQW